MNKFFAAAPLALALASLTVLPGCQSETRAPAPTAAAAPAPAPPPPTPAGDACEGAVLASFQKSRGHAKDAITFAADMRKATPGKADLIAVTGAGTYPKADGKAIKVTYSCSYNAKTAKVASSRYR